MGVNSHPESCVVEYLPLKRQAFEANEKGIPPLATPTIYLRAKAGDIIAQRGFGHPTKLRGKCVPPWVGRVTGNLMKTIHFASSNPEKILEVGQILGGMGIRVRKLLADLDELRSENQEEVAIGKAKNAFALIKKPVIAEDTGVYFEAFGNFPGAFPSFVFRSIGYGGILALLKGRGRGAYFKTIVAYYDGKKVMTFKGFCRGKITSGPDLPKFRNPKLPYEAIFVPEGHGVRMSRISKAQKNTFSHRALAIRRFGKWFLRQE